MKAVPKEHLATKLVKLAKKKTTNIKEKLIALPTDGTTEGDSCYSTEFVSYLEGESFEVLQARFMKKWLKDTGDTLTDFDYMYGDLSSFLIIPEVKYKQLCKIFSVFAQPSFDFMQIFKTMSGLGFIDGPRYNDGAYYSWNSGVRQCLKVEAIDQVKRPKKKKDSKKVSKTPSVQGKKVSKTTRVRKRPLSHPK